jgi:hypothetical protein
MLGTKLGVFMLEGRIFAENDKSILSAWRASRLISESAGRPLPLVLETPH